MIQETHSYRRERWYAMHSIDLYYLKGHVSAIDETETLGLDPAYH